MPMILRRGLFALLIVLLLAACQAKDTGPGPWTSADLRVLQAPDREDPALDLIAAYARVTGTDLELRVDFLGSPGAFDYDVYAALGAEGASAGQFPLDEPPGLSWRVAVGLPARGAPRAFDSTGQPVKLRPRILRGAELDSATLRFSLAELHTLLPGEPRETAFQVFVTRPGERQGMDKTPVLKVNGPAVAASAPLLLAFWDTLPSDTPAQALRRWDGAHTGPYGQRHGLRVLLDAAEETGVPLALLDLTRPERLAALEALGGLEQVQHMAKAGLLILPETSYGDPRLWQASRADSRAAARWFKLPESSFFYGAADGPTGARAAFASLAVMCMADWNGERMVPLPVEDIMEDQAGIEALSTTTRAALLEAALSDDPGDLVVLGGSLPRSVWGDSLIAGPSLRYIAGHPWIHALNAREVLDFPAQVGQPDCPDLLCLPTPEGNPPALVEREGVFARQARQIALRLSDPTTDDRLKALREIYLGQIELLREASQWETTPIEQAGCAVDLTGDRLSDCVLSSQRVLLILDPRGGRLALAATRVNGRMVQVIGPRAQFAVGLGDALEWQPERGLLADPQEIPGAFADAGPEWVVYETQVQPGEVVLTHPQTGVVKRFQITENGMQFRLEDAGTTNMLIPLALVDEKAFEPGWYTRYSPLPASENSTWRWKLEGAAQVGVSAQGATLTAHHFAESRARLVHSEDPNAEYPPGHFIPFPLAVVEAQPQGETDVTINIEIAEP